MRQKTEDQEETGKKHDGIQGLKWGEQKFS